jgi:hypothetical protein
MSIEFYQFIHYVGIFLVVSSLTSLAFFMLNGGAKATNKHRVLIASAHGLGLLVIFISGFGLGGKMGYMANWPHWITVKILIWLTLGGLVTLIYKKPSQAKVLWVGVIALATCAAYLAVFKPF